MSVVLLPGSSIPAGYWAWFYPNLYAMVGKAHLAAIASTPAASVGEMEKDWTAVQRPLMAPNAVGRRDIN